jgi:hypothetical protein
MVVMLTQRIRETNCIWIKDTLLDLSILHRMLQVRNSMKQDMKWWWFWSLDTGKKGGEKIHAFYTFIITLFIQPLPSSLPLLSVVQVGDAFDFPTIRKCYLKQLFHFSVMPMFFILPFHVPMQILFSLVIEIKVNCYCLSYPAQYQLS